MLNSMTAGLVVRTVILIQKEPIAVTMIAIKKLCGMIPATTHGPVALVHLKVVKMTRGMRIMTEKALIDPEILDTSMMTVDARIEQLRAKMCLRTFSGETKMNLLPQTTHKITKTHLAVQFHQILISMTTQIS